MNPKPFKPRSGFQTGEPQRRPRPLHPKSDSDIRPNLQNFDLQHELDDDIDQELPLARRRDGGKPPLRLFTTTLWEYPSQHYDAATAVGPTDPVQKPQVFLTGDRRRMQGDKNYIGATPSWVIWQLLQRYTREKDVIVDPMCGGGTTIDVSIDLGRLGRGFDLAPSRDDIQQADARALPMKDQLADFVFIDPPYSTHIEYSPDPRCIGKLDALGDDGGEAYFLAMSQVINEIYRVLKPRRYMALYVSDTFRKRKTGIGVFSAIGFELFAMLQERFRTIDIIAVKRQNSKLQRGNWHKSAEEGNFYMRGFNYLFIMKKEVAEGPQRKPVSNNQNR